MLSEVEDLTGLANAIIGLSSRPGDAPDLLRLLTQNSTLIGSKAAELLNVLDFSEHSLACVYVLWSWRDGARDRPNPQGDLEWTRQASRCLIKCDMAPLEHIRRKFLAVAQGVKAEALLLGQPGLAINPLLHAARKFAPAADHLTPLHADVFQICLMAQNYAAAKELLLCDVYEMDPMLTSLTPTDFLLYCYYGGRLCIGLKWNQRALELFQLALVAPTLASNAITLMIYKLYVLVSLLETGVVADLPKYASNAVSRMTRSVSMTPYIRLIDAYKEFSNENVQAVVENFKETYEEDGCMGLVKQMIESLVRRDIKALTQSYTTRSLSDIAAATSVLSERETEHVIVQMVREKQIAAQISCRNSMVTFMDNTDGYDDAETTGQLNNAIQEVVRLGERMQDVKDKIELDPEYRNKVLQTKQHSKLDC